MFIVLPLNMYTYTNILEVAGTAGYAGAYPAYPVDPPLGEAESRDTIVWRQTIGRDAELRRVERNCASHESKKTNKPATIRDEHTIGILHFLL
jgi:hypothetical protein